MKKLFMLILMLLPAALPAHKAYIKEMPAIIGEADLVMTAKVTKAVTKRGTCETDYIYLLSPDRVLKGSCDGSGIPFYYTVHFWDEEKGCPSVHYILPPVPRTVAQGQTVIAAFKKDTGAGGGLWGTGMFEIGELDAVMKLLKK